MTSSFATEATASISLTPVISAEELKVLIANLFLYRRQKDMPRSWHVVTGVPMNSIAVHTYLGLQAFVLIATRMGLSRELIALGILLFLNHDLDELLTVDKNIYSSQFLNVHAHNAMVAIMHGHPFSDMNWHIHYDYEFGKKGHHTEADINLVCTLLKDVDGLEPVLEQLEGVARGSYPVRRWKRPEIQAENAYKSENYYHDDVRRLHAVIVTEGMELFTAYVGDYIFKTADDFSTARHLFTLRKESEAHAVRTKYYYLQRYQNIGLQTYFRMQVFVVLAQLAGREREKIAEGLYIIMTHSNPYARFSDPLINDACLMEELLEHMDDAAVAKSDLWNHIGNVNARESSRHAYSTPTARWLHEAIVAYGLDAFDDAFIRLPNTMKNGTHGKT